MSPTSPFPGLVSVYTTIYQVTATYHVPSANATGFTTSSVYGYTIGIEYWAYTLGTIGPLQLVNISSLAALTGTPRTTRPPGGSCTPDHTDSSAPPTTASVTPPAATSSAAASSAAASNSTAPIPTNVGLTAGVGVLAVLLMLSIAGLGFLLFRGSE